MARSKKEMDETSNPAVYKKARKIHICTKTGKCTYCSMHGGENAKRFKHGSKKPRKKDKR